MIADIFSQRTCCNCPFNDGMCYTSYPAKYKCTLDNNYYEGFHPCHFELTLVRHAKWVHMEDYESPIYSTWMCNSCKGKVYMSLDDSPDTHGFTYCPMCGARMDGGTNNAAS